jgi:hypothetical protein
VARTANDLSGQLTESGNNDLVRDRSVNFYVVHIQRLSMVAQGRIMEEQKSMGNAKLFKAFFGYRDGDRLQDFAQELKQLTDEEKAQIVQGIEDRSMTY